MKKIITRHLIICILITCVSNFSFTSAKFVQITKTKDEYCKTATAICGTASAPMNLLMDFVREMMNSIHTIGTEGDYVGKYVSPNRFKGEDFQPPVKTIVGKLASNVAQKLKFGLATTAIFANPINFAGGKDVVGGTVLLTKNKIFLRDTKIIDELESQLSDKKFELGLGGGRYDNIIPENIQIMRAIINSYVDKGLFKTASIEDGTSYTNVTSLLTQMLSAAKSFLYFDSIDQFNTITRGGTKGVTIMFDDNAMQTIQFDYSCARGISNPCDSALKDFKKNMKALRSNAGTSWTDTKRVFNDAIKRLGQLFSKGQEEDFTTRENELLRSMYGNAKTTPGKLIDVSVDESNGSAKDIGNTVASGVNTVRSRFQANKKNIKSTEQELQQITRSDVGSNSIDSAFTKIMNDYVADVFASQGVDAQLAAYSEVKDVTPAFEVLGRQVYVVEKDILGGKDKDSSLIKSLGEACELQCGRGGRCR